MDRSTLTTRNAISYFRLRTERGRASPGMCAHPFGLDGAIAPMFPLTVPLYSQNKWTDKSQNTTAGCQGSAGRNSPTFRPTSSTSWASPFPSGTSRNTPHAGHMPKGRQDWTSGRGSPCPLRTETWPVWRQGGRPCSSPSISAPTGAFRSGSSPLGVRSAWCSQGM